MHTSICFVRSCILGFEPNLPAFPSTRRRVLQDDESCDLRTDRQCLVVGTDLVSLGSNRSQICLPASRAEHDPRHQCNAVSKRSRLSFLIFPHMDPLRCHLREPSERQTNEYRIGAVVVIALQHQRVIAISLRWTLKETSQHRLDFCLPRKFKPFQTTYSAPQNLDGWSVLPWDRLCLHCRVREEAQNRKHGYKI
jgi:hypothetical protein